MAASASRRLWFWLWTRSDIFWNARAVIVRLSDSRVSAVEALPVASAIDMTPAFVVRRLADQVLELIQLRQHRHAFLFVERVGELGHLPPDETLLAVALALARTAEAVEGDQVGAEHVHRAGDPSHLVAPAGPFDPGLEVAARQCVQHPHAIEQRRKGTGHVVSETDQHENQEGDHGTDGDPTYLFLPAGKHRHVLDAH